MKIRLASSPTTLLLNNKCLGSTIICVCLRKHRKIYFLPNCRYPHTAAGGAGSAAGRFILSVPFCPWAAFTRMNSVSGCTEKESVSQFFHILGSVEQQRGCCDVGDGKYEITLYTSCAMQAKAFIIIRLMKTVRSLLWICTMKPWPVRGGALSSDSGAASQNAKLIFSGG